MLHACTCVRSPCVNYPWSPAGYSCAFSPCMHLPRESPSPVHHDPRLVALCASGHERCVRQDGDSSSSRLVSPHPPILPSLLSSVLAPRTAPSSPHVILSLPPLPASRKRPPMPLHLCWAAGAAPPSWYFGSVQGRLPRLAPAASGRNTLLLRCSASGGDGAGGPDPVLEEQKRRRDELSARASSGEFTAQGPGSVLPKFLIVSTHFFRLDHVAPVVIG